MPLRKRREVLLTAVTNCGGVEYRWTADGSLRFRPSMMTSIDIYLGWHFRDTVATKGFKMRILVLGGSSELGELVFDAVLRSRHTVEFLHRGWRIEWDSECADKIYQCDRTRDPLPRGEWDWIIDFGGQSIPAVNRSVRHFRSMTRRYLFISSTAVYRSFAGDGDIYENAALLEDHGSLRLTQYGFTKVIGERMVRENYGTDCSLILRPGIITYPRDPTGWSQFWLGVFSTAGSSVTAPFAPEQKVEWLDARDLAETLAWLIDHDIRGTYNLSGPGIAPPEERIEFTQMLDLCRQIVCPSKTLNWVAESELLRGGACPSNTPFWLAGDKSLQAAYRISSEALNNLGSPGFRVPQATLEWLFRSLSVHGKARSLVSDYLLRMNRLEPTATGGE